MLRIRHLAVCLFTAGLLSASSLALADNKPMNMSFDQVQQAAIQGDPDAEYALGYMYYYGNGTTRDQKSAMDWIGKAAAQGQPEAIKALKLLGQSDNSNANSPNNAVPAATANNTAGNNPANNAAANNNNPANMANNTNAIANANMSNAAGNQAAIAGNAPATVTGTASSAEANTNAAAATSPASANGPTAATTAASVTPSADQQPAQARHHERGRHEAANREETSGHGLSQKKLLSAPSSYYTVQLMGSYRESDLTQFLRRHQLQKDAGFYQTSHHNRDWYVLVYGIYHSEAQAKEAIDRLPPSVRKLNPWIKSIHAVKSSIKQAEAGNRSAEG